MRINLQNYEEYFVSYLDGELSSQEVAEVEFFLQQHPGLKAELNAFKLTMLSGDEEISFPKKELLKKGITLVNYEDYFIRKVEGDLSPSEAIDLSAFMNQHPELQREMNAYAATKLIADSSTVFPNKNSLKRRDRRVIPMYVRYGVVVALAASLMLIVMMRGVNWNNISINSQVAEQPVSSPSSQEENKSNNSASEVKKQASPSNSEIASSQTVNSAEKNIAEKVNHKENKNTSKKNSQLFADASHDKSNSSPENLQANASENISDEMTLIGSGIQPISYQARFKKASYRDLPVMAANENSSRENNSPLKFTSVASTLGSELLRLSGREDYLKTSSAFNAQEGEKKKVPLVLNIKGKKFDFYHKFFKKRNQSSSEQKQN